MVVEVKPTLMILSQLLIGLWLSYQWNHAKPSQSITAGAIPNFSSSISLSTRK